ETESGPQLCDDHTPTVRACLIHKSCLSVLNAQTHEAAIVTISQRQVTAASRNALVEMRLYPEATVSLYRSNIKLVQTQSRPYPSSYLPFAGEIIQLNDST
ncbi:hypothetical protein M9458_056142, partial [Cirrhinus mrigala]